MRFRHAQMTRHDRSSLCLLFAGNLSNAKRKPSKLNSFVPTILAQMPCVCYPNGLNISCNWAKLHRNRSDIGRSDRGGGSKMRGTISGARQGPAHRLRGQIKGHPGADLFGWKRVGDRAGYRRRGCFGGTLGHFIQFFIFSFLFVPPLSRRALFGGLIEVASIAVHRPNTPFFF